MFVIDANLDCEAKWSGLALSPAVLARISLYGMLVSALAPHGAPVELWTPAAVDRLRWRGGGLIQSRVGAPATAELRWADPAAKAANDRRLARTVEGLPGSFVLEAIDREHAWPASWVAKAVWSAAGRDRCRGNGAPNQEQRTRMSRLLAACGALVVEPWCERILDLGVCATTSADGVKAEPPHGVIVDGRGGFLGIDLAPPKLEPDERAELDARVGRAGEVLRDTGYTGPFTVDAFVHATPPPDGRGTAGDNGRALHVCEINARYTFGWIARALSRRTGCTRLGFGTPPEKSTTLIEDRGDHVTAWIA